ncbi:MAG: YgiQ family radical SAM protein [Candidatus Omnitrophota bacterium]
MKKFLPISRNDLKERGISQLDIILITGDAYCDHPSYGAAVIGRVLEDAGFTVGVIAQPDWRSTRDFMRLGRPRLFFGITAGNLDSMVANYTANKRPREGDEYSPGGVAGLRPDRALIKYANMVRQAFENAPIVIGGLEASLRRFAHYDYWDNAPRRSILLDAKADVLVYGMGERQVVEIARRLNNGASIKEIDGIKGTVVARGAAAIPEVYNALPSFEEVAADTDAFNRAFREIYRESDPFRGKTLVQKHGSRSIVAFPPAEPLSTAEFDRVAALAYVRAQHPSYEALGGIPGYAMATASVIATRGCCGECAFCSLYFHQGRIVQSRSRESVLAEIDRIAADKHFTGTITDIGGPTANLYGARCKLWKTAGACKDKKCLMPEKCRHLELGFDELVRLLADARTRPGVRHVFLSSGLRYDLLLDAYSDRFLGELCAHHVSGQLKVAPEHIAPHVLALMNKPSAGAYEAFEKRFYSCSKKIGKEQYLVNYLISGHPGSTLKDALELSLYLMEHKIHPEQVQDFIPLPLTTAGCMYYTEKDPFTGAKVYVAKTFTERKMQRALIQYKNPGSKALILDALRVLGRMDLKKRFIW